MRLAAAARNNRCCPAASSRSSGAAAAAAAVGLRLLSGWQRTLAGAFMPVGRGGALLVATALIVGTALNVAADLDHVPMVADHSTELSERSDGFDARESLAHRWVPVTALDVAAARVISDLMALMPEKAKRTCELSAHSQKLNRCCDGPELPRATRVINALHDAYGDLGVHHRVALPRRSHIGCRHDRHRW